MATVTIRRKIAGEFKPVDLVDGAESLQKRGVLPGAFGWDRAAHLFRTLQAEGSDPLQLLPAAFPTSWMVNAKATSRTFVQWTVMEDSWRRVFEVLRFDTSLDEWSKLEPETRTRLLADVTWMIGNSPRSDILAARTALAA